MAQSEIQHFGDLDHFFEGDTSTLHPSIQHHHNHHVALHLAAVGSYYHCESSRSPRLYWSPAVPKPVPKMRRRRGHMTVVLFCTSLVFLGREGCKGRSNQAEEITGNIAIKNHRPGELVSLVYVDPCVASWGDGRSKMRLSRLWNTLIPRTISNVQYRNTALLVVWTDVNIYFSVIDTARQFVLYI